MQEDYSPTSEKTSSFNVNIGLPFCVELLLTSLMYVFCAIHIFTA